MILNQVDLGRDLKHDILASKIMVSFICHDFNLIMKLDFYLEIVSIHKKNW